MDVEKEFGKDVVAFIQTHIGLIEQNTKESWESFYTTATDFFTNRRISHITQVLLLAGIDPANVLTHIPDNYLRNAIIDKYHIPENITSIGDRAFQSSDIKSIIIPQNVQQMGDHVFFNCKELEECIIESDKLKYIPDLTFDNCGKLKRIVLPKNIQEFSTDCLGTYVLKQQQLVIEYPGTSDEFTSIVNIGLGTNNFDVKCSDKTFHVDTRNQFFGVDDEDTIQ